MDLGRRGISLPAGDVERECLAEVQQEQRLRGMKTLVRLGKVSNPTWPAAHRC